MCGYFIISLLHWMERNGYHRERNITIMTTYIFWVILKEWNWKKEEAELAERQGGGFSLWVWRDTRYWVKHKISTKEERLPKGGRLTGLKWLRLSRKAEPGIKLLRWEGENIQGERQYIAIGIYRGRLGGVGSFTRALKNSTNTASNYTTINKAAAQVQMRHLTECAQQIQQLPGESIFEGPRGCSRDAVPSTGRTKQVLPSTALPLLTCCQQIKMSNA